MTVPIVDRIPVIDADTHVSEPEDLWTSRVAAKHGDSIPHTAYSERRGGRMWIVGGKPLVDVGTFAMAGWPEYMPSHPPTLEDADPAAWDPRARLQRMDERGIRTQVVYPNLIGFFVGAFMALGEEGLLLECVQAYNDFLAEWASVDPERLVPVMMLPYWDIDQCVREMDRCMPLGHRGIVAAGRLDGFGHPAMRDQHWDPLWAAAQERGLPVNFHVGFNPDLGQLNGPRGAFSAPSFVEESAQSFIANTRTLAEAICSGMLHRFPELKIVSVESGIGWVSFFLEALDWQWENCGLVHEFPDRLLPSEYFERQAYVTYWFERRDLAHHALRFQDNLMFSTDFPHPTSQSPGPASIGVNPRDYVEETLADVPEPVVRKLLHDNAARLYGLPSPFVT